MNWRLLRPSGRKEIEREIEEELNFHLELLTERQLQQDISPEDARVVALERFGNIQRIKDQCVAIRKNSSPFLRALKSFLAVVFLSGLLVRMLNTNLDIRHIGELLIALPVLTHLLLYVRGVGPSHLPKHQTSLSLMLRHSDEISSATAEPVIMGPPRPTSSK